VHTDDDIAAAIRDVDRSSEDVGQSRAALIDAEKSYGQLAAQINQVTLAINGRSRRIELLVAQLPPEEAVLHKQRSSLATMKGRQEELKLTLETKRELFRAYVQVLNREVVGKAAAIKEAFDQFAEGFLFENCELTWSPQKAPVGQEGVKVDYPAYELDMTGSNFSSAVRRSGPDQVSESQREFIDLAFRMALIAVASDNKGGSLVIDAPESSLDAVFVTRAANVLSRFAKRSKNYRLIVTSNLVEGDLIPTMLVKSAPKGGRRERILDLLSIATPTAAIKQFGDEYTRIRNGLLKRIETTDA
jgi:hypothetical protein